MVSWKEADNFPSTEVLSITEVKVSLHQQKDVQIGLQRDQIQNHLNERSLTVLHWDHHVPLFNIAVSNWMTSVKVDTNVIPLETL